MKALYFSVLILAAGCVPVERAPGSGGEVIRIKQGNAAAFHKLRLGVTNIARADFTDEAGMNKRGSVAGLTLVVEGDPPQEKDFQVHAGQRIVMAGYSVYLEEIRGTLKGTVTLRVEELPR